MVHHIGLINGTLTMKKQCGAVVIYMAAMAAVLAMMVVFVYNTGHISNEKTRLQNTTDAAVHSVATLEARDLNFQAYMNRSMVANQVAIGQAVSLVSWTRFLDNGIQTLKDYTFWVPYWGAYITEAANISTEVKNGVEEAGGIFVNIENQLIQILSIAQSSMHTIVVIQIPLTMHEVIKANDPGVSDGLITNSMLLTQLVKNYSNAISRYDPENVKNKSGSNWKEDKVRMDEFRNVTMNSRDGFTADRTYKFLELPSFVTGWDLRQKIEKAGGTDLIGSDSNASYYTWAGMDTLAVHDRHWKCNFSGCGWSSWKERLPLMYGAGQTGDAIKYAKFKGASFGSTWKINKTTTGFDAKEFQNANKVGTFSGLRQFSDITQKGLLDKMPPTVVLLTKNQGGGDGVRTARATGFVQNGSAIDLEQAGGMANNRLHAMAKAEAYFSRPTDLWPRPAAQGGREYGNLYNPFWQPRLTKLTATERAGAVALANIQ
jgi:Flp pilus assembly protein TadG